MRTVVLFLHPSSKFGVLGQMMRDLKTAFERAGTRAVLMEFQGEDPSELIERVRKENPDCTWSINTYVDERWFYYPFGIPHVDLSVDSVTYSSPATFFQPSVVSLFVDKTSCDLFSDYSDNPVRWFPHGISLEIIDQVRSSRQIPLKSRQYDVTLIGSFLDHRGEKRCWDILFTPSDVEAFISLAERSLDDTSFLLLSASLSYMEQTPSVKEVFERRGLSPFFLANSIERYARGLDRERLLRALKGRSVHIFTEAEDSALWSKEEEAKGCVFHPPVPFKEVVNICLMSKAVINSIPHIRKGYHERLFLSLASGAVTLVRKGLELPSWLLETGRIVEYTSSFLGNLVPQLRDAENRHYEPEKILPWLQGEHSWDARLTQHTPEIEKSLAKIHADWEKNPFWNVLD
jgi:hypothetical protein